MNIDDLTATSSAPRDIPSPRAAGSLSDDSVQHLQQLSQQQPQQHPHQSHHPPQPNNNINTASSQEQLKHPPSQVFSNLRLPAGRRPTNPEKLASYNQKIDTILKQREELRSSNNFASHDQASIMSEPTQSNLTPANKRAYIETLSPENVMHQHQNAS